MELAPRLSINEALCDGPQRREDGWRVDDEEVAQRFGVVVLGGRGGVGRLWRWVVGQTSAPRPDVDIVLNTKTLGQCPSRLGPDDLAVSALAYLVKLHRLLEEGQRIGVRSEGHALKVENDNVLRHVIPKALAARVNVQHADLKRTDGRREVQRRWRVGGASAHHNPSLNGLRPSHRRTHLHEEGVAPAKVLAVERL